MQILMSEKCAVSLMDGFEYSLELVIVPLKEPITENSFWT